MSDFLLISALAELSSGKGFGFNSNFLEANVLNIALLVSGVFYLGKNFLTSALELRQQKVTEAIQEAEERLQQANARLLDSEKQLTEAQTVIEKIKKEAETTARTVTQIKREPKQKGEPQITNAQYGKRKSWIILMQLFIIAGLVMLSIVNPKENLSLFAFFAFFHFVS